MSYKWNYIEYKYLCMAIQHLLILLFLSLYFSSPDPQYREGDVEKNHHHSSDKIVEGEKKLSSYINRWMEINYKGNSSNCSGKYIATKTMTRN